MKVFMSKRRHLCQNEGIYVKMKVFRSKRRYLCQNEDIYVKMKVFMSKWRYLCQNEGIYVKEKVLRSKWRHVIAWPDMLLAGLEGATALITRHSFLHNPFWSPSHRWVGVRWSLGHQLTGGWPGYVEDTNSPVRWLPGYLEDTNSPVRWCPLKSGTLTHRWDGDHFLQIRSKWRY